MQINELAKISGVSTRTLRYYDEIGLLRPAQKSDGGYRLYSQHEIDLLQQILFYRALGMKLAQIKKMIYREDFHVMSALQSHRQKLHDKRAELDTLINTVEQTIQSIEEGITMSNEEKFQGFKKEQLRQNEEKYGEEIRRKYGNEAVETSNKQWMDMSEEQYENMQALEHALFERLQEAMEENDATSPLAQEVAELHKRWLLFSWKEYTPNMHAGLAEMYTADERFTAYYDERVKTGATQFLADCIIAYTKK